jgi:hypothetical protein
VSERRIREIFAEASAVHAATAERSARPLAQAVDAMRAALRQEGPGRRCGSAIGWWETLSPVM